MNTCPTCGAPVSAVCKDCEQPLKRWVSTERGWAQWVHAGEWATCPSRGEPKPKVAA